MRYLTDTKPQSTKLMIKELKYSPQQKFYLNFMNCNKSKKTTRKMFKTQLIYTKQRWILSIMRT